jgi:hypothetical protein
MYDDARFIETTIVENAGNAFQTRQAPLELYQALCNNEWSHPSRGKMAVTWRMAGAIADSVSKGYIDHTENDGFGYNRYYCAGKEGEVTVNIRKKLEKLGFVQVVY